jgi:hypothetical protein
MQSRRDRYGEAVPLDRFSDFDMFLINGKMHAYFFGTSQRDESTYSCPVLTVMRCACLALSVKRREDSGLGQGSSQS